MLKTRLFAAGTGVLAAATFALAGCGTEPQPSSNGSTPPPTSSAPQVSAKEAFSNALKKLNNTTSKATMTMDGAAAMTGTAQTDPAGKKATATNEVSAAGTKVKTDIISLNGEVWVKMGGVPGLPDKWMHVSADKVKPGSSLDISKDSTAKLDSAVVSVERNGTNGYKGTLDMTKAGTVNADLLNQLGDKAKAVPFTMTVDAQERPTEMVVDMSGLMSGMGKLTTKYSGFGEPVTVSAPPAADVIEMPATILDAMNKVQSA